MSPPDLVQEARHRLIPLQLDAIPRELLVRSQWVCMRLEVRNGKVTKVPISSETGLQASTMDRATWATFDIVCSARRRLGLDGIGFVFSSDDVYCGIDVDHSRDRETGQLNSLAQTILGELDSYAEASCGGEGIHIIVRGRLPGGGRNNRRLGVEMYDRGRFFVMTGAHVDGAPTTIDDRQGAVDALYARLGGAPAPKPVGTAGAHVARSFCDDLDILRRACNASNGARVAALMRGELSGYPSASEADSALCFHLAFYTKDPDQIERLYLQSGLARDKWHEQHYGTGESYGERVIARALAIVTETAYRPSRAHRSRHGPSV